MTTSVRKTTKHSGQLTPARSTTEITKSPAKFDALYKHASYIELKNEQERERLADQLFEQCTFKPKLGITL